MEQRTVQANRITMLQEGRPVPRFPSTPLTSSAGAQWTEIRLEHHRLRLQEEWSGVIDGYQICLNAGDPVLVNWKIDGKFCSKVVDRNELCLASNGRLRNVSWNSPLSVLLFSLSTKLLCEYTDEFGSGRAPELIEHRGLQDPQIQTILRMLYADIRADSPAGSLYGEQLGVALATYLVNRFNAAGNKRERHGTELPGWALQKVLQFVDERLEGSIGLEELAREARVSRFHFARLFRNSTGRSPCQFVVDCRLQRVKERLERTSDSIAEIAKATGFSSHSHLTAVFRGRTGATPRAYRLMRG